VPIQEFERADDLFVRRPWRFKLGPFSPELGQYLAFRSPLCPYTNVHGNPTGEAAAFMMRPTIMPSASSKRLGSRYVSGRTRDWLKFKNPMAPAVRREAEEDWG
jgi:hypothetical protein